VVGVARLLIPLYIKHYQEFLRGKAARQIGASWQKVDRSQYFEGGRVLSAALSAIDIALHDAIAKNLGVPVPHLNSGKHSTYIDGMDLTLTTNFE